MAEQEGQDYDDQRQEDQSAADADFTREPDAAPHTEAQEPASDVPADSELIEMQENDPDADQKSDLEKQIEARMLAEFVAAEKAQKEAEKAQKETEAEPEHDRKDQAPSPAKAEEPQEVPLRPEVIAASRGGVIPVHGESRTKETPSRRKLMMPLLLVFNVAVMLALVGAVLVFRPWRPQTGIGAQQAQSDSAPTEQRPAQSIDPPGKGSLPVRSQPPAQRNDYQEPVTYSWAETEKKFFARDFRSALDGYLALLRRSTSRPDNQLISDFLRFREAQCRMYLGQDQEAEKLYTDLALSDSPIVRAVAYYQLAARDVLNGQFLRGRMRAYLAIASLAAVQMPMALETDCDFLIARALTGKVLSYSTEENPIRWRGWHTADPFANLSESDLGELLAAGSRRVAQAVLGPEIKPVVTESGGRRYSVTAMKASIEQLLTRFVAQAGMNLEWVSVAPAVRRRSLSIRYSQVSEQRFSEVSCGAVGLLARSDGEKILVHDPQSAPVLSQQKDLLCKEAVSAWRRLFLRAPEDPRVPQGHFALAVIEEIAADPSAAMREYRIIANRFGRNAVAPAALLRLAAARIRMRDYSGARRDLLDLLDRYPDCPSSEKVYLFLGQATAQAGLLDEAVAVFRKLYYLNLTEKSQRKACIGAARCFARMGNFKEAGVWATRYIGLVESPGEDLAEAYMLLGESQAAAGAAGEATKAYYQVLASGPSPDLRVRAILELAAAEARRENFVGAVGALGKIHAMRLTPAQTYRYLLTTAQIYRAMGLSDKAAVILRNNLGSAFEPEMRARLALELADCLVDEGEPADAAKVLAEFLPGMKAGPMNQQATCRLAEIYVRLDKTDQAVTLITELLKSPCRADIRRRAQKVLGTAYLKTHDYDRAALALSGLMFEQGGRKK